MWLFTKYGFYSVVCARQENGKGNTDPDHVMIRARLRSHLEALAERFPRELDYKIHESDDTDYAFRIFVWKGTWTNIAHQLANEIDYDNFKAASHRQPVKSERDHLHYHRALGDVWGTMHDVQERLR